MERRLSDVEASEAVESAASEEAAELEPGEVPNLDVVDEMELNETGDLSEMAEAEGEGTSQSLMKNFLEDATATDNDDQPVSVDAPDAREPALDNWEDKEKP